MSSIDRSWFKSDTGVKALQSVRLMDRLKVFGLLEKPNLPPSFSQYEEVPFKIFICGKSFCGKTWFIQSLCSTASFNNHSKLFDNDEYIETPGIQITNLYWPVKMTNSDKFKMFNLKFWDIGKLAFIKYNDHIKPSCFENLDCIIYVFSWIDKQSFIEVLDSIKENRAIHENHPIIIIGTKFDKIIHSDIEPELIDEIQRLSKNKIINFSAAVNVTFDQISHIMNKISEMANKKLRCKYGEKCFRKNPEHIKKYEHSPLEDDDVNESQNSLEESKNTKDLDKSLNKTDKLDALTKVTDDKIPSNEAVETSEFEKTEKFDLSTISDIEKFVTETNRMKMPDDFYQFFDFCKSLNSSDPKNALNDIGIELTGIYDLITHGYKLDYKLHARYFYDPPEFQTVLKVNNSPSDLHFGYFRDDPDEVPSFVGISEPKLDCKIHCKGDNLFSAINWYIDELISGKSYKIERSIETLKKLKTKFDDWCENLKTSKSFSLNLKTPRIKSRDKKVNAKTFHTAGIVVPVDSKGFGYRDIPESYEKQKNIFKSFCLTDSDTDSKLKKTKANDRIQEIITLIQFANDETDYGMGLEFGLNMFLFGDKALHKYVKITLPVCYELLGRNFYSEIIIEHLKNRK